MAWWHCAALQRTACGKFLLDFSRAFSFCGEGVLMAKNTFRELAQPLHVRLHSADMNRLNVIANNLDLDKSEIARRCIHEGLRCFVGMKLPGTPAVAESKND